MNATSPGARIHHPHPVPAPHLAGDAHLVADHHRPHDVVVGAGAGPDVGRFPHRHQPLDRLHAVAVSCRALQLDLVVLLARLGAAGIGLVGTALRSLEREVPDAGPRLLLEDREAGGEVPVVGLGRELDIVPAERDLAVDGAEAHGSLRGKVRKGRGLDIAVAGLGDPSDGSLAAEGEALDIRLLPPRRSDHGVSAASTAATPAATSARLCPNGAMHDSAPAS